MRNSLVGVGSFKQRGSACRLGGKTAAASDSGDSLFFPSYTRLSEWIL